MCGSWASVVFSSFAAVKMYFVTSRAPDMNVNAVNFEWGNVDYHGCPRINSLNRVLAAVSVV